MKTSRIANQPKHLRKAVSAEVVIMRFAQELHFHSKTIRCDTFITNKTTVGSPVIPVNVAVSTGVTEKVPVPN